ncbi:hypothetical protein KOW79_002565 [Hemibagrus wyckioides]|uniref:Uncharacterized protein n=1 Tax=Hemibagrus wyckioides TaxID=337641 RepID=A0A9D3SWX3_9TELE|nr:hypothetical protein KOW79_002565 [Hemibagrus wyckioides]
MRLNALGARKCEVPALPRTVCARVSEPSCVDANKPRSSGLRFTRRLQTHSTPSAVFHSDQEDKQARSSRLGLTEKVPSIFDSEKAVLLEQR